MTGTGSSRIWTRASGRRGISVPRQEVERNSLHSGANRLKTRLFPAIDRGSTQERMHGRRRTETEPQGAAFSLESNADPGEIGRAPVCTPVTHALPVCSLLLDKKKQTLYQQNSTSQYTM